VKKLVALALLVVLASVGFAAFRWSIWYSSSQNSGTDWRWQNGNGNCAIQIRNQQSGVRVVFPVASYMAPPESTGAPRQAHTRLIGDDGGVKGQVSLGPVKGESVSLVSILTCDEVTHLDVYNTAAERDDACSHGFVRCEQ